MKRCRGSKVFIMLQGQQGFFMMLQGQQDPLKRCGGSRVGLWVLQGQQGCLASCCRGSRN